MRKEDLANKRANCFRNRIAAIVLSFNAVGCATVQVDHDQLSVMHANATYYDLAISSGNVEQIASAMLIMFENMETLGPNVVEAVLSTKAIGDFMASQAEVKSFYNNLPETDQSRLDEIFESIDLSKASEQEVLTATLRVSEVIRPHMAMLRSTNLTDMAVDNTGSGQNQNSDETLREGSETVTVTRDESGRLVFDLSGPR